MVSIDRDVSNAVNNSVPALGGDYYPRTTRAEILQQAAPASAAVLGRQDQDMINRNCEHHNPALGTRLLGLYFLAVAALTVDCTGVKMFSDDADNGNKTAEKTTEQLEINQHPALVRN